jgi:hypothetical protein
MIKPELLIKINADLKDFNSKMDQVKKKTEELSDTLGKVGLIAGATFAGLSVVTFKTVEAFKGAKQASNQLEQSLKTQGIFSEELLQSYKGMASELQKLVAVDDDAVIAGQAILQRFVGQNKITKELTLATIDFAQANKLDLDSAFKLVGKTIGSSMNPLARQYGIELQDGLTVSEKMAVVTQKLNDKFAGQAKAVADAKGPFEALKLSFADFQEGVGEQLEPLLNGFADTLNSITLSVNDNQTAFKAIAVIIAGGLGVAGLTTLIVLATQAFVALTATAVTLGVTLTALTGGIFAVVAGIGLLVAGIATADKTPKFKNTVEATEKLIELQKKLANYEKQKKQGLAVDPEIQVTKLKIDGIKKQIASLEQLKKTQEKAGSVTSGKETIDALEAEAKKREELKKQREDDAKKEIEDRKKLKKELVDAGKDEFTTLADLRDRRIKLANGDKELLLLIEKEYQDKRFKLQKETDDKLADLRKAQAEYEKAQREKSIKDIQSASSNPFSIIEGFGDKTDKEKKDALLGAGAGVLNNVSRGAEGARNLVVTGAKTGINAFAPGLGDALEPLLQVFSQGPEATRAMVKEFAQALPDIIQGFIEAIPVFIEEMANQMPIIIERLAEKAPEIIKGLVKAMPRVAIALALEMPKIAIALIKELPNIAVQFVTSLVKEAPRFITELIKEIGKGIGNVGGGILKGGGNILGDIVGGVGDVFSSVGDFFGFATGGQIFAKGVPSGFANDSYPAMLSSGELVVDRSTASGLRDFINRENAGGGDVNTSLLSQILSIVSAPITVDTSVQVNQKAFADIILQLNRQNQRLA